LEAIIDLKGEKKKKPSLIVRAEVRFPARATGRKNAKILHDLGRLKPESVF
jgi:hypothetical protein